MNTPITSTLSRAINTNTRKSWIFLILLFSCSTIQAQSPTFTITPSVTTPVPPGTTITFDVTVENYINIISTQFSISWNPTILDFISIDTPNASDFPFLSTTNFGITTTSAGFFNISWLESSLTPVSVFDGTRMFSFTMTTLTDGTSVVQIDPNETQEIINGDFTDVGLIADNTSIEVIEVVVSPVLVPTMSEWGLFLFGLTMLNLGLVFVYKKQLRYS